MKNELEEKSIELFPLNSYSSVIHFLVILTEEEIEKIGRGNINEQYDYALKKARPYGGIEYHNAIYGGGIKFTESPYKILKIIREILIKEGEKNLPIHFKFIY